MAVEHLKVQLEFRMGPDGWSEIIYMAGSDPRATTASSKAIGLARERLKLLASAGVIHHIRISPANEQTIRSYRFPLIAGAGGDARARDVGGVTVTVGLYGQNSAFRTIKLHGVPDVGNFFDISGVYSSGLGGDLRSYVQYLVANEFEIKHRVQGAKLVTLAHVTDITYVSPNVFLEMPTAGFAANDKITVSGAKGVNVRQFNKNWTVKSVEVGPPAGLKLSASSGVSLPFSYTGGTAVVRINNIATAYSFSKITSFDDFVQPGTRKTGRPTDEHRGRVSGRR